MFYLVNIPSDQNSETFLSGIGKRELNTDMDLSSVPRQHVLVILVKNPNNTYWPCIPSSDRDLKSMLNDDPRQKTLYMVRISSIKSYVAEGVLEQFE